MVCRLHAHKSETNESRNVNVDKKKGKKKTLHDETIAKLFENDTGRRTR